MSARRPATLAIIVVAAVLAGVGTGVAGTQPDDPGVTDGGPPPETEPFPDDFTVPSGYTTLVDDTGRLTVAVPDTWDDVDTAPTTGDGFAVPRIEASPDRSQWSESYAAPGALYAAYPYDSDVVAVYEEHAAADGDCVDEEVVDYDDGAFVGRWWQHTGCGPDGEAQWHAIVASPASAALTAVVIVQITSPQDRPILDVVLRSFNLTPTATWPTATTTPSSASPTTSSSTSTTSSPPSTSPSSSTSSPSTTSTTSSTSTSTSTTSTTSGPGSSTPADTRRLVDNSNLLAITVPATWTDVNTAFGTNDDGSDRPSIAAAPNIADFLGGYDMPGTRVFALPPDVDLATVLTNVDYAPSCQTTGTEPFDNERFNGLSQTWTNCAGSATQLVVVAARPADASFTLFVEVQETADDRYATAIIDSVTLVDGASYPTTTLPTSASTVGAVPASLLFGTVQPGAVTVVDASGSISVSVPPEWTQRRLDSVFNDDMSRRPRIVAATDVEEIFTEWTIPGVIFLEYPYTDASTLLANLGWDDDCTNGGLRSFDNGTYRGYLQTWTGCGGTTTRIVSVAVSPADNSATLYLEVQLPSDDDAPLQTILASFQQR